MKKLLDCERNEMTRILSLFQIKTVGSAWAFLVGSAILFLFSAFQAI
jgi:hypothetical protein